MNRFAVEQQKLKFRSKYDQYKMLHYNIKYLPTNNLHEIVHFLLSTFRKWPFQFKKAILSRKKIW